MSNTPRTDNCIDIANDEGIEDVKFCEVIASFARQLERELAEARAEIERLKAEIRDNNYLAARQIVPAEMAVDDLRAELERKDALIEQMRRALAVACLYEMSSAHMETIDAALSAAERIKL